MLFDPPQRKSNCLVTNTAGSRPVSGTGLLVAASSSAWAEVVASTTSDSYGFLLNTNSANTTATNVTRLIDVGVGASGSEVVLIPKILAGQESPYATLGGAFLYFPVFIKAGTRIAVRGTNVARDIRVFLQLIQQPLMPDGFVYGTYCEAIGYTNDTTGGTAVTSGTTNKGSWTSLGTTTVPLFAWELSAKVINTDATNVAATYHVDIAVGNGSSFTTLVQDAHLNTTTTEIRTFQAPLFCNHHPVKAGSTIYARAQCNATPDPLVVMAYGVG